KAVDISAANTGVSVKKNTGNCARGRGQREVLHGRLRYPEIFEASRPMLSDPDKIYPGQTLRIPAQVS
ncbi:MAG: hypothetical protein ACN6QA_34195, partial [Cupriavidus sp.]